MAFLVDTNVIVYRHDPRFPAKRELATELLREGIAVNQAVLPYQAVIEFVAATTRHIPGEDRGLLKRPEALREAELLLEQFRILYPTEPVLRQAVRGCAAYGLAWFDALIWAYAEHFGLPELLSEDFQEGAVYGTVRIVNPFSRPVE